MLAQLVVGGIVLAVIGFQLWVTYRVRRSHLFDAEQKSRQTKLIWLLPVLGSALVFSILSEDEAAARRRAGQTTQRNS